MTITRDPEYLPTHPGSYRLPWQAQPSFFAALEVDLVTDEGVRHITNLEVERILASPRTHDSFMGEQRFGEGELNWVEWLDWQTHRDPIVEDPQAAELLQESWVAERRGPGIAKRPRRTRKST